MRFMVTLQSRVAKDCHGDPAEMRGKQSPVIHVEERESRKGASPCAPYKTAFPRDAGFQSSQGQTHAGRD
jgi:hypothetical protein